MGVLDPGLSPGHRIHGYEVLGNDKDLPGLVARLGIEGVAMAIGDNASRARAVEMVRALSPTVEFTTHIHPSAQIARDVRVNQGTVVMAGCVINSGAKIGSFCILNTHSTIEHDVQVGDFVSFAPNACAGGSSTIGDHAAICLGANVVNRVIVGAYTVVGAGATVLRDLPSNVVAYGTPARIIRSRNPGDKYM